MRVSSLAIAVITSLLSITIAGCAKGVANGKAKGHPEIPVVTTVVEQRTVPLVLKVVGTVESTGSVALQSRVDGQITQMYVHDGDEVKAGQRLMQIDPALYELQKRMAQAALDRDIAKLDNATSKSNRGATLFADHYISIDEHTQLQTDLEGAAATVAADRAALDNATLQLSYTTITAPVAGKLGHIAQQVGNTVHTAAQTSLITLNVLDTVDVSFAIPEQELSQVRNAAAVNSIPVQASVSTGANTDEQSSIAEGKLTFIDNAADTATGTIKLRARFDNAKRILWPGQLATVTLALPTQESSIVVPSAAINEGPQGTYLYVVAGDSIAELRSVKVQRVAGDLTVATGVNVGERIVIDGQSRLTPKARVVEQAQQASL